MSRIFTFGCSFTQWNWPSWADIIAHELKLPYQNWGIPGLGNVGIQARLIECDLRNKFNKDDLVFVVWSSWTREDRFDVRKTLLTHASWNGTGDILHSYDKKFIDNYWSMNNDIMKNSTAIISANKMFDIKFNGHISTPIASSYDDLNLGFSDHEKEIALFYEPHIPNDGEYQENKKHPCRYNKINDSHPDILAHLDYVREFIVPKLGITLSKSTVDFFEEMHYTLFEFIENNMNTTDGIDYRLKIPTVLTQFNWSNDKLEGF